MLCPPILVRSLAAVWLLGSPLAVRPVVAVPLPGTNPASVPVPRPGVPVLYLSPEATPPLPQEKVDELLRAAGGAKPVWFIAAVNTDPKHYRFVIYHVPDRSSPRVRAGRCVVRWWWNGGKPLTREYVHVSRPDSPFGEKLELPPVRDWPFEPPVDQEGKRTMDDAELVRLVDFARPHFDRYYDVLKLREPFYRVVAYRNEHFEVVTGRPGLGAVLPVRRRDDGYEVEGRVEAWAGPRY